MEPDEFDDEKIAKADRKTRKQMVRDYLRIHGNEIPVKEIAKKFGVSTASVYRFRSAWKKERERKSEEVEDQNPYDLTDFTEDQIHRVQKITRDTLEHLDGFPSPLDFFVFLRFRRLIDVLPLPLQIVALKELCEEIEKGRETMASVSEERGPTVEESYKVNLSCNNCGHEGTYSIPLGTEVDIALMDTLCENCGCRTLSKTEPPKKVPIYIPPLPIPPIIPAPRTLWAPQVRHFQGSQDRTHGRFDVFWIKTSAIPGDKSKRGHFTLE